jgi:hypothetical protein
LVENKELFDQMSVKAYEFAKREFDYDQITKSLIGFYQSL